MSLGEVKGVVAGQFGEVSEDTHALIAAFATSRVRVAGVTRGRRGRWKTEEGNCCHGTASTPWCDGCQVPGFKPPQAAGNLGTWRHCSPCQAPASRRAGEEVAAGDEGTGAGH